MSLDTWTPAALRSEARGYSRAVWRLVESQARASTRKVVDTLAEQAVLEDILEPTKPRVPAECAHLEYLLATPFRYGAPYPTGSRFRRPGYSPGVFYASEAVETALAERSFGLMLFFAESPGTAPPTGFSDHTAFLADVATNSVDLTAPPLDADKALWTHPTDCVATQALADAARAGGIGAIRYASARHRGGVNLALLTCRGFAEPRTHGHATWRIRLAGDRVTAICPYPEDALEFTRDEFADPRLGVAR